MSNEQKTLKPLFARLNKCQEVSSLFFATINLNYKQSNNNKIIIKMARKPTRKHLVG